MSSDEKEQDDDPLRETVSVPDTSILAADEALRRLEDHRCAICQNIIINACRIDCGHTYCRHCLNTDRENRNSGTKQTCFICDAAVTEITHNAERDKEIDDLYAVLPTNERLSRARAKADRKVEEENFTKRSKERASDSQREENETTSSESIGSGDACNSCMSNHAELHDGFSWGNDNMRREFTSPAFYGESFRIWQGENVHSRDEIDGNYSESNEDFNNRFDRERRMPFSRPPVVIHHTVQHVYHTVEVRNSGRENDEENREDGNCCLRHGHPRQLTHWNDHENNTAPERLHFRPPGFRTPPPQTQAYHHPPQQCFNAPYSPYHQQNTVCGSSPARFYFHNPYCFGYPHQHPPMYPSGMSYQVGSFHNQLPENSARCDFHHDHPLARSHAFCTPAQDDLPSDENTEFRIRFHDEDGNDQLRNLSNRSRGNECADDLCEFHRTVFRDRPRSNESISASSILDLEGSRSYEVLSPHSSNSRHFLGESRMSTREDLYDSDRDDDHEDPVITFRISVPVGEIAEEAMERRNSPPGYLEVTSFR